MSEEHKVDAPTEQESDYTPVSFFRLLAIPACLVLAVFGLTLLGALFSGKGQNVSLNSGIGVLLLHYIAFVLTIIAARQK
ncbi:MAG TPA: hypothetical protein DD670_17780 [Planctomycetaceae bacterium]|nr:hypothetical protein [Planctomycetaceae bacterium]